MKAQVAISTLQAQHLADKATMERVANDIAELLAVQEDMGCRLARLDEYEQYIRTTMESADASNAVDPLFSEESFIDTAPMTFAEEVISTNSASATVCRDLCLRLISY